MTEKLAALGYLVTADVPTRSPSPWSHWGALAWAYHETISAGGPMDRSAPAEAIEPGEREPRPSSFRALDSQPILLLPRLSTQSRKGFIEVLETRRTHRQFT